MGQQASRPKPGTEIQVIGAGLSRTGTASFSAALEILLDGPVYHGGTQATLGDPIEITSLIEILKLWLANKPENKDAIQRLLSKRFAGFAAVTDAPTSQLVPELMALYPNAKVICTVRDPEKWAKSVEQIQGKVSIFLLGAILLPLPGMRHFTTFVDCLGRQWRRAYGESTPTIETYYRHIEWLKEIVPEDRLVFFNVKDGWEPLCKALGKEVPKDIEFPFVNDGEAIENTAKYHIRRGLQRWLGIFAAVGVVAASRYYWVLNH